jgi:serine/threonine protein kinase
MEKNEKKSDSDDIINRTFFSKYRCIKKLGEGSFGSIYKAEYNGDYYALKFESIEKGQNLLENEAIIMNYLKGPNIPYIKLYGSTSEYNILVMQLLGKSLETIFEEKKKFSLKTVCMLGYQFVSALEYIHNRHILHRDIKPDNFVMGLNNLSQYVYILDFGLAKKYRSSTTLKQLPLVNRKKLTGTARYASINALKGYEHSRRDDLEAVGYVLVYFLKGRLPWQGFTAKNKEERYRKILKKKMEVTPRELCEDLPEEFEHYITYTRNMEYLEEPDYEMLRGLFNSVLIKDHSKFDYIYDWTTPEEKLMRRVITPKSELESYQNKKTTYASFKHFYDSREENYNDKSIYLTLENSKKNLINKYNNNTNGNRENKENNDNIIKKCKKNKQPQPEGSEEPIIISKKKGYLETLSNEEDDVICCSSGCNVF